MIPAEDRPASWLGSYGGVEADIRKMREFADRLRAEVESNYAPSLRYIADDMVTEVPNPADAFIELVHFMRAHQETQQAATNAVWGVGDTTGHLAEAAKIVADQYGDADAFSAARLADIQRAFGRAGVLPAQPASSPSPTGPTGGDTTGQVVLP
ncbi:hypothetical protein [Micromonospora sp. LOL_024]|uniref:hypothetical protein n=1 Tax=Micromonospora sp. LOL_024 TaxID=3345412 RepID=UPI003A8B931F